MKLKFILILTIVSSLFSADILARDAYTKTSFKVSGNCDICKERIEKAAKVEGVKNAVWDQESHILTVAFAPAKITLEQIQQNIANAGYDTPMFKSTEENYKKLPQCCQYSKE